MVGQKNRESGVGSGRQRDREKEGRKERAMAPHLLSVSPSLLLSVSLSLLLSILSVEAQRAPELTREEKWRGDLPYLFVELPKRHKNLFFKISPQQFDREIAGIIESVPKFSDSEIKFALRRLTAMIGDPHTRISFNVVKTYPVTL